MPNRWAAHLSDLYQGKRCLFLSIGQHGQRYYRSNKDCIVTHFKIVDEGNRSTEWGGDPTYWLEVNDDGHAERQIEQYPNGNVISYDKIQARDEYGALAIMVVDGDETFWRPYQIT